MQVRKKNKNLEKGLKQLEHRGPDATKKIELLDQALDLILSGIERLAIHPFYSR